MKGEEKIDRHPGGRQGLDIPLLCRIVPRIVGEIVGGSVSNCVLAIPFISQRTDIEVIGDVNGYAIFIPHPASTGPMKAYRVCEQLLKSGQWSQSEKGAVHIISIFTRLTPTACRRHRSGTGN